MEMILGKQYKHIISEALVPQGENREEQEGDDWWDSRGCGTPRPAAMVPHQTQAGV